MNAAGQTVCLNMIVKDETPVIRRCLDSVRPIIDHWVISDTGSSDGTQEMIRDHMSDLPGELIERPWVDFAHNRSEALAHARGRADYLLIIDADEMLDFDEGFVLPELSADAYQFEMRSGGISYYKTQLVRDDLDWSFRSVVHEYIYSEKAQSEARMPGLRTLRFPDGARARDPLTYRKDALILEDALLREPANARYMFYLAQSYRDAGEPALALDRYRKRVAMGGWIEEVWYSLYQIAHLKRALEAPWPEVLEAFLKAYETKPDRAEPLYQIGYHYQASREFASANLFFERALAIPFPKNDQLFVEKSVYDALLPLEAAVASFYVGDHARSIAINNGLLAGEETPPELIEQIIRNRRFSLDALHPKPSEPPAERSSVRACIIFTDAGPHLDNCVESLLLQQNTDFSAVFVDNGSTRDHAAKIPLEDARFSLIRNDEPIGWSAALRQAAAGAEPDDILVILDGVHWLADTDSLNAIETFFREHGCAAMHGRYRYSNGRLGRATPFCSPAELADETRPEPTILPIALRASLLEEAPEDEFSPLGLLRLAGFDRIGFDDTVSVVWNLDA